MLFHEKLNFYSQGPDVLPFKNPNDHKFQNLKDLIEVQQAFSLPPYRRSEHRVKFKHQERRALAAKLALHLSIFCPWEHTSTPWDGRSIHFVDLPSNDHNRVAPYISWDITHDSGNTSEPAPAVDQLALTETFTALAKLLLEIEYGRMPEYDTLDEGNLRERVKEYYEQWKEHGDLSKREYLEAIDACLGFRRVYKNARLVRLARTESPEETFRRLIRTNIASKIVADLPDFQPPEEIRARAAPMKSQDTQDFLADSDWHVPDSLDEAELSSVLKSQSRRPLLSETVHRQGMHIQIMIKHND